jgi:hypothetical protein
VSARQSGANQQDAIVRDGVKITVGLRHPDRHVVRHRTMASAAARLLRAYATQFEVFFLLYSGRPSSVTRQRSPSRDFGSFGCYPLPNCPFKTHQ